MAARRTTRRDDEDALDPVEAADVEAEEEDLDDGFDEEPDLDDVEEEPDLDDVEEEPDLDDEAAEALEDDAEVDELAPDDDVAELDPDAPVAAVASDATFDDEDDEIVAAVTAEDEGEVDGVQEGEFVCRSCYMAKRETQLADPERMLCRDCA